MEQKIKLYGNYERYWHWAQFGAIATLTLTGFEIHSSYELMGYERAVNVHNVAGWGYSILLVFTLFWMLVTGMYRQFLPTTKRFHEQFRFYALGIMKNEPHPVKKTPENKMNPIQRLTYFGLMWFLLPLQVLTGLLYLYTNIAKDLFGIESIRWIALLHTLMAFMVIVFVIVHVYMITTGHTLTAYLEGMITGKEKVEVHE
ncbi:cytochrome b/b6 domain-containing protein [Roseimarinus sediminis]|jgi:thiosulfate reductase cytochrome b subunit|uniref:cytochrome b/b6 domain-containing protein n=1 Tax=Roseimarinus sediminis TaxID=1610899 RepID=UPI003D25A4F3